MVDKILKYGGWVAAFVLALTLFVQSYLVEKPFPTSDPVTVEAPAVVE